MKLRLLLIVTIGAALGAAAQDAAKDAKDLDRLQGTWALISMEVNGMTLDEEKLKGVGFTFVVENDQVTIKCNDEVRGTSTIKLDPTKKPKAFDSTGTDAAGNTHGSLSIYKLEGDTLTTCTVLAGKDRPTDFQAAAGSEAMLQVFRRQKN
jgi:uncharacterized protein (TIGR03067 family)